MPEATSRARNPRTHARGFVLLTAIAAALGGSLALAPAALAAPSVDQVTITSSPSVDEGDTVEVTVAAADSADLFAYELTVEYDPALLSFDDDSALFPDGGFDAVTPGTDDDLATVTFTNTRLGTSPGLDGDVTLVSFTFSALAGGDAEIALASVTLVGSDAVTSAPALPEPAVTAIVPAPVAPVPSASPSASPSAAAPITPSPTATTTAVSGQPLASTGADATPWLITGAVAVALIALGSAFVIRRRMVTE